MSGQEFAVKNTTGEVWPAFAMGEIGDIDSDRFGVGEGVPVYVLRKPTGDDGASEYVVNGPTPLADGETADVQHWRDATHVRVKDDVTVSKDDIIGATADEWFCSQTNDGFRALDAKGDLDIVPVIWVPSGGTSTITTTTGCACTPAISPDIEVSGKKATYEVTVALEKALEFQECGILILKKATYTLTNTGTKTTPTTTWSYTLQAGDMEARDYTGAEKAFTAAGTITWQPLLTPKAKLIIDAPIVLAP